MAKVISEKDILSIMCRDCFARPKTMCFDPRGVICKAHPMRIRDAQQLAAQRLLATEVTIEDQALILYYSYMMLCDSVSAKSKEILGIELDTQQIQTSFAKRAVQALQQEGLIRTPQKASA